MSKLPSAGSAARPIRFFASLLLVTALAACGGGGGAPTDVGSDDAVADGGSGVGSGDGSGTDGGAGGGAAGGDGSPVDGGGGSGAVPVVDTSLGLDRRPANASCLAPGEPGGGIVREQPMYPSLPFEGALLNLEQARGDGSHWFTHTRDGRIYRFTTNGDGSDARLIADLRDRLTGLEFEGGLIGFTLDPDFVTNGHVYLHYTGNGASPLQAVISRMTVRGDRVDPASEIVIQRIDHSTAIHLGGRMAFGPDRLLYVSVGDGEFGDPRNRVQDPEDLHGKLLRYDVSNTRPDAPFEVPVGNPHRGNPLCTNGTSRLDCPEWLATGLRNPWRFSFDRASAVPDIWLSDVGHEAWEEINRIGPGGGNFGWSIREGSGCFGGGSACSTFSPEGEPLLPPYYEYPNNNFAAVVGGYVYRGSALPGLAGDFVFADYAQSQIHVLRGNRQRENLIAQTPGNPVAFAEDNAGEIYFLIYAPTGTRIFKLVPTGQRGDAVPERLSETGCVAPDDPSKVLDVMVPYQPRAPFWSEGATKDRWLAIPDGTRIRINAQGQLDFPVGSVLMKSFRLNGRLIETRLMMRHTDTANWAGYSYRWNEDQTEAVRVRDETRVNIDGQTWIYPSGSQCQQCHTVVGGKTLGTTLSQLNWDLTYAASGRTANQLHTLAGLGMMEPAPVAAPTRVSPYDESQSLTARARSWLDTNCANCHRDDGPLPTRLDLRLAASTDEAGYCNRQAGYDLGIAGARLVVPGDPQRSVLYLRATRRDGLQMPPVGSTRIDPDGERLLADWIRSMDADCQ